MVRSKPSNLAAVPDQQEQQQEQTAYELEPLTDDMRSKLHVWGNATQLTIQQLREDAPSWAQILDDIFTTVGEAIKERST